MNKAVKLFIVEGEDRDYRFVEEMKRCFFKGRYETRTIAIPASQNIYMLYNQLREEEYEIDVVELLRDTVPSAEDVLKDVSRQDIDEVFLFFDYDAHQNNLKHSESDDEDVLREMLDFFDNETENGKLYVSYPMVEALYDYMDESCEAFSDCFVSMKELSEYKKVSGKDNPMAGRHMQIEEWKTVLKVFVQRISCLFGLETISFEKYRKMISPCSIYDREYMLAESEEKVFVLSPFGEFLFDYFKIDFWNSMGTKKEN